jgi:hypothetical protein
MDEYYELTLTHRVQNGGRYDRHIEQPLTVKCFVSPLVYKAAFPQASRAALIDDMCRKLKEYWMQKEVTTYADS